MKLEAISKFRDEWFGIAIISIMIFHFCEDYVNAFHNGIVDKNILIFGYYGIISSIGVEIFMFLSGLGLFFSMSNNDSIKVFYKKRVKRLVIPYIPVGILIWGIWDFIINNRGITGFLEDFTFISFFTEGQIGLWFIGVILLFYLVFPIVYKVSTSKHGIVKILILIFLLYLGMYFFMSVNVTVFDRIEIGVLRFPCFMLGAICGYCIKKCKKIPRVIWALIVLCGISFKIADLIFHFPIFFTRIVASIYGISIILIGSAILEKIKLEKLYSGLRKVGGYSLELYMFHVGLRKIFKSFGLETYNIAIYIFLILLSIICSIALHKGVQKIESMSNEN